MKKEGFTIIELLIVIALMGVLLVIGFNTFGMYRGRSRQNLRDISTQFYRDYSLIRMDAVAQNLPFMIQFSINDPAIDSIKYSFFRYDVISSSWDEYRLGGGKGVQDRLCGPFVSSDDSNVQIVFDSNGMVVNPNDFFSPQNIVFTLSIERGNMRDEHTIEIYPSGGIHVTKKLDEE